MNIKYVGWIPGSAKDRRRLRQLGVRGRMNYNASVETHYGVGAFENCEASWEVLEKLVYDWGLPNIGSFTAINQWGWQLPHRRQRAWKSHLSG